jgi:hypothetical protein
VKTKLGKAQKQMQMDTMDMKIEMPAQCGVEGRMQLAHAYVLWQTYDNAFCPQEALMKGTLFPELYGVYMIPN